MEHLDFIGAFLFYRYDVLDGKGHERWRDATVHQVYKGKLSVWYNYS